jgi:hypothetical protein
MSELIAMMVFGGVPYQIERTGFDLDLKVKTTDGFVGSSGFTYDPVFKLIDQYRLSGEDANLMEGVKYLSGSAFMDSQDPEYHTERDL